MSRRSSSPELRIRPRGPGDLDALLAMARRVRDRDRYPIYEPAKGLPHFYRDSDPSVLGVWVAHRNGRLVGHVALHTRGTASATAVAAAHAPDAPAAFVSRLVVDPTSRGARIGAHLLEHARVTALEWDRMPFLEALDVPEGAPALGLYRAQGWTELDRIAFDLTDDGIEEVVFAGPTRPQSSPHGPDPDDPQTATDDGR